MIREDPISKLVSTQSSAQNLVGQSLNSKSVKITSVVLDGKHDLIRSRDETILQFRLWDWSPMNISDN
jgi:hypothetical protein